MQLLIDPQGDIVAIYEEVLDWTALGAVAIRRASHVEPDAEAQWWAAMTPVGGPTLGPYRQRSQALDAERVWLEQHWLCAADRDQRFTSS